MEPAAINVIIVDDHPLMRAGIREQLQGSSVVRVVGEGSAGDHLLALVQRYHPDVALLDLVMPQHEGGSVRDGGQLFDPVPAISEVLTRFPKTRILVLSQELRLPVIENLVNAGANGYLLKDDALTSSLVAAIRMVHNGGMCFSPDVTRAIMERRNEHPQPDDLTPREKEILAFAIQHADTDNAEIANSLGISPNTYKWHLKNIREKLGVQTHTAAALKGVQMGLADPNALSF